MKRWFWVAFACGIVLRVYLAIASFGTDDVLLWEMHARGVAKIGLAKYYSHSPLFNHPPASGLVMAWAYQLADGLIPFKVFYRLFVVACDAGNVLLLVRILRDKPWRWFAGAVYALSPLAITLTGQHGNLDAIVATVAMCGVLAVSSGRVVLAGVLIGLGSWIKLPALFAAPALGFALPRWRDRIACAAIALVVGGAPCVWGMWSTRNMFAAVKSPDDESRYVDRSPTAPNVFVRRVFHYQGMEMKLPDPRGRWLWGWRNVVVKFAGPPPQWPGWVRALSDHIVAIALGAIVLLAFLRRGERDPCALGASVALSFVLFYGLVNNCATQYFAWSAPLWLCLDRRVGVTLHVLGGIFIYGLYVVWCTDWLLRPAWQFNAVIQWPGWLSLSRDVFNLSMLAVGVGALIHELYRASKRASNRAEAHASLAAQPGHE